jgi:hypothetical protein
VNVAFGCLGPSWQSHWRHLHCATLGSSALYSDTKQPEAENINWLCKPNSGTCRLSLAQLKFGRRCMQATAIHSCQMWSPVALSHSARQSRRCFTQRRRRAATNNHRANRCINRSRHGMKMTQSAVAGRSDFTRRQKALGALRKIEETVRSRGGRQARMRSTVLRASDTSRPC